MFVILLEKVDVDIGDMNIPIYVDFENEKKSPDAIFDFYMTVKLYKSCMSGKI